MFLLYGNPNITEADRENGMDNLGGHYQKKGPSYSQLQKKKKKVKKSEKKKQTFYEKVLSKTIGDPIDPDYVYTRNTVDNRYYVDPMNQTHHIQIMSSQLPPTGRESVPVS